MREHTNINLSHSIEIFSQGDLQRISEDGNDSLRLALIDRPHAEIVAQLHTDRNAHAKELRHLGESLRDVRIRQAAVRQEVQPIRGLRNDLRELLSLFPELSPELEVQRELHERRRQSIETLGNIQQIRQRLLDRLVDLATAAEEFGAAQASLESQNPPGLDAVAAPIKALGRALDELAKASAKIEFADLTPAIERLKSKFERDSEPYYKLRQQQQDANKALKQQHHLERQIEQLERKQRELENLAATQEDLLRQREDCRAKVDAIDEQIYELRVNEISEINAEHDGTVHLTLVTGTGAPRYVEQISNLLSGSRVRLREDVAKTLAGTFPPGALIDIVEEENGQRLAEVLSRDLGQMNRVVAHLADHSDLYSLEGMPPAARLEITFFDNNEPKAVETLSKGQKATALLPLILRPLPYPLLFDQPEDDLDNSFIFNTLIKTVQKLRNQRQLIFVTHNANIPVLAGADKIVVMRMATPTSAGEPLVGTVDERKREILDLLEGGAEAFLQREKSYSEILARGDFER